MKLSFTTLGCPDWDHDTIIKNGREYGYDGIELRTHNDGNHFSPNSSLDEGRAVAQRYRDGGCPIMSLMAYSVFASDDDNVVRENQELLDRVIDLAAAMEVPNIRIFGGRMAEGADREQAIEAVANAVRPGAQKAHDAGVRLGMETHDDWCLAENLLRVVGLVDSPGFGIVYDLFNAFHEVPDVSWEETYQAVKAHVVYCHVKDAYITDDGHHYTMLGAGDVPYDDVVARLKADGYDGYFSFEWEKKWIPALEDPERSFPHYVHKMRKYWAAG